MEKVLIVEDDSSVVALMINELNDLGFSCDSVADGRVGLNRALDKEYMLVIFDLGLPSLGGMEGCRQLRAKRPRQPILVVTGETAESKTVLALELGADDYITKPFRPSEFRARVRALLRRTKNWTGEEDSQSDKSSSTLEQITVRDLIIDKAQRKILSQTGELMVSPIEFELLCLLASNPNRVYQRDEILKLVWGFDSSAYSENIRSHVSRLNRKLSEIGTDGPYVENVRGFGYRIAAPRDPA